MLKPMQTPLTATGASIRAEMARRGVTQAQLATHLGISQSRVSARIRGKCDWSVTELTKTAELLNVPVLSLLTDSQAA